MGKLQLEYPGLYGKVVTNRSFSQTSEKKDNALGARVRQREAKTSSDTGLTYTVACKSSMSCILFPFLFLCVILWTTHRVLSQHQPHPEKALGRASLLIPACIAPYWPPQCHMFPPEHLFAPLSVVCP